MKKSVSFLLLIIVVASCNNSRQISTGVNIDPFNYQSQKNIIVSHGAVVSAHPLASKVGMEILKMGGNAVDAAIATQLALAVVYPNAGNLGGGGFFVAALKDGNLTIDYREKAPGRAHRDMYIDPDGTARTDKSQDGHLSAGVPGTVAGIFACYKYAKLPFKVLIQPAINLANDGFVISEGDARAFNGMQAELKKLNSVMPVFVKEQKWKAHDTLVQKDLARTLERIRDEGAKGFYEGETARLIIEEMQLGNGIISYEDLKNYTAKERVPHIFTYKEYEIIGMPMPSSGGLLLHQMMKMIEGRNIAAMGFHSPQATQLMTEVERRAYADRAEYMGDEDFYKVPVDMLTSEKYLAERMSDYDPSKAGNSVQVKPGRLPREESSETTHLSVVDKDGNAVSITTTLNNSYGSKTVVGGAGFFLNDEMDDFSIKPGVPNMYGAVGGDANAIQPGKRMLSSMTPTIVMKDNKPFIIVGTPGGTTIPTSVFQTLVNLLEFKLSAPDAVNEAKFHHQWLPDTLKVEKGFPAATLQALNKMGYITTTLSSIGRVELIVLRENGKIEAVADKRGADSAEGY